MKKRKPGSPAILAADEMAGNTRLQDAYHGHGGSYVQCDDGPRHRVPPAGGLFGPAPNAVAPLTPTKE